MAAKADETLHQILTIYPLEHVDGLTAEYEQHETEKDVSAAEKTVHQQSHEANDKTWGFIFEMVCKIIRDFFI